MVIKNMSKNIVRGQQKQDEITIFKKFVSVCPYKIDLATIEQCDPPSPDIFCSIVDGNIRHFELVECIDSSIAKQLSTSIDFRTACLDGIKNLFITQQEIFNTKYNNASIYIFFHSDVAGNKKKEIIVSLLNCLLLLKDEFVGEIHLDEEKSLNKLIKKIHIARGSFNGPSFDSNNGGSFSDPTLERIVDKFRKNYQLQGNLDLLAYYDIQPLLRESIWLPKVKKHVEENMQQSQFSGVWIYSVHENRIIYSYPQQ